jgi:hypothetical protein
MHNAQPEAVAPVRGTKTLAIILNNEVRTRRPDMAAHPEVVGAGVFPCIGDGFLHDAQQFLFNLKPQSDGSLIEGEMHSYPTL